jgi:glyoxylase-like metal-dependent hydrolase (beta-lactamase superfamily II)
MAANGFAADNGVFTYKVGDFEVSTLVEARNTGNGSVILGATKEQLDKYVPGNAYNAETNAFVIKTPNNIIMVDTGFGREIFNNLTKLGIKPEQVGAVLITHLHGDHIGGLQKGDKPLFPNASVYLAAEEMASADAGAKASLAPYGAKVRTFQAGSLDAPVEILTGIKAIAAFGHTPGHTVFLVESKGKSLLIWGDLVHVEGIQFPYPSVAVRWDTDSNTAIAARTRILTYVAKNRIPVAGMHLLYPAIGTVNAVKTGYEFVPVK